MYFIILDTTTISSTSFSVLVTSAISLSVEPEMTDETSSTYYYSDLTATPTYDASAASTAIASTNSSTTTVTATITPTPVTGKCYNFYILI